MSKARVIATLLAASLALPIIGAGAAYAGPAEPGTVKATTADSVAEANAAVIAACADPASTACAAAIDNAQKEAASLARVNGGPTTDVGTPVLTDVHNTATGVVKSANIDWISNSRGLSGGLSGANFIHYENLNYDFMFGDGPGGLSIYSLKDPEKPLYVGSIPFQQMLQPADIHGPADGSTRYWEGENMTVDAKRKLVYLARDPRSFGNSSHPNGRTGLYIIDVADPWHPRIVNYHWVPAGHTATCINDCRYLWSMGPANNGSHVSGQPQDIAGVLHPEWTGVPVFVTDVRDPEHPYTYAQPVDLKRNNNTTAYTHSADVDQDGIVWTSGFGGVRGFWTRGRHYDPVQKVNRWATATDPIPYAGGSVTSSDPTFATNILEHNSFHVTQAPDDTSSPTVTAANGRVFRKKDLQYITQENVVSCTSTSGGGSGRFVVATLAGSYGGEAWDPKWSNTNGNRYFLEKIGDYSAKNLLGNLASGSCSAHWFTVVGDMVVIAFYNQGIRVLDMSDPTLPTQVGYIRIPSSPATNASAAYWHGGYIYTADYSRGVDVFRYTGEMKGVVQPNDACWNSCGTLQLDSEAAPPMTVAAVSPAKLNGFYGGPAAVTLMATVGAGASADAADQLLTEYSVDGAPSFSEYDSPVAVSGEGTHTLLYRSHDQADNVLEPTRALIFQIDTIAPATTATRSVSPNSAGWNATAVTVDLAANDGTDSSGVDRIEYSLSGAQTGSGELDASGSVPISEEGVTTLTYSAIDRAGNAEEPATLQVSIDTTAPAVGCAAPDGAWHAANVSSACTASDGGSGLDDPADASFSLTTGVPAGTETATAETDTHAVCDLAGNCSTAGPVAPHKIDRKSPSIAITSPADGASYLLNEFAFASFGCSDGGSDVDTCSGTTMSGALIDTSSVGYHSYTVAATDNVGNPSTKTVTYNVHWSFEGFNPPVDAPPVVNVAKAGSAIPVKFGLGGNRGLGILAAGYPKSSPMACGSTAPEETVDETVAASQSSLQIGNNQYTYVWKTDAAWAGTCRQLVVKLVDNTTHTALVRFK